MSTNDFTVLNFLTENWQTFTASDIHGMTVHSIEVRLYRLIDASQKTIEVEDSERANAMSDGLGRVQMVEMANLTDKNSFSLSLSTSLPWALLSVLRIFLPF